MKVWSLKQQQQKDAQADGSGQKKKKKVTAAQLRVQKGKRMIREAQDNLREHISSPVAFNRDRVSKHEDTIC